jgi:hypothetical protein
MLPGERKDIKYPSFISLVPKIIFFIVYLSPLTFSGLLDQ